MKKIRTIFASPFILLSFGFGAIALMIHGKDGYEKLIWSLVKDIHKMFCRDCDLYKN